MSATPVVHLELRISPRIFEKIRNGPIDILRGLGKLIHEKKQKSKISWHCPFNVGHVRFASKIIFFLSNVFATLRKLFSCYLMYSLRFENNFLAILCVRFASKIIFLLSDMFAFASKTVVLLSNVFASLRK